jgi:hypothetical protein
MAAVCLDSPSAVFGQPFSVVFGKPFRGVLGQHFSGVFGQPFSGVLGENFSPRKTLIYRLPWTILWGRQPYRRHDVVTQSLRTAQLSNLKKFKFHFAIKKNKMALRILPKNYRNSGTLL